MNEEMVRSHRKLKKHKRLLLIVIIVLIVGGLGVNGWLYLNHNGSLVPKNVSRSVNFPVYYPDPKKLPSGYTLRRDSFKYISDQGVIYYVTYGDNKKLVFTIQLKPSDDELNNFNGKYIPIHRQILTEVGTATEGAIGKQTVVSLPVDASNAWIIVTGPSNIYATSDLTLILRAIRSN